MYVSKKVHYEIPYKEEGYDQLNQFYSVEKVENSTFSYAYLLREIKSNNLKKKYYKLFKHFMRKSPLFSDKYYYL